MYEIGRLCVKLAGRDAGMKCVVVDVIDKHTVLIDGQTRRRKCNIHHLEPLDIIIEISKGASSQEVVKALAGHQISVAEKKGAKKAAEKPKAVRKKKEAPAPKEGKTKTSDEQSKPAAKKQPKKAL